MLKNSLTRHDVRTRKGIKNIIGMLFLKGGQILIGLLLVPMTINYVDSETYGIWLTISSMVAWMSFFDIGVNNGLKNKLTEAIAKRDLKSAKAYVSTTYAILALIFIPLMFITFLIIPFVDWKMVLNVSSMKIESLVLSIYVVVVYFCLNSVLSTINIVLLADQRPADQSFRTFVQQLFSLLVIFIMTKLVPGSLVNLCLALCLCPLAVIFVFNIILFRGRYKAMSPSITAIDFRLTPNLMKLGIMFFVIQIAGIIQYQLTNFLIIHYFGPTEVTAYNIAYKYFNVAYMVWGILTVPIWAAVADAIAKNDFEWIRCTVKKYEMILCVFAFGLILMFLLSQYIYKLWLGDSVVIGSSLSFWVMMFNLVMMYCSIYISVLNGASILKVQSILSLFSTVFFLFLCFYLIHMGCGVESILISSIFANINGLLVAPIQYKRFISKKTHC